jgi:hypothetical protein
MDCVTFKNSMIAAPFAAFVRFGRSVQSRRFNYPARSSFPLNGL